MQCGRAMLCGHNPDNAPRFVVDATESLYGGLRHTALFLTGGITSAVRIRP